MAFLAVSAIKQKDLVNAVGVALQHSIIMRYMLEADQTERGGNSCNLGYSRRVASAWHSTVGFGQQPRV